MQLRCALLVVLAVGMAVADAAAADFDDVGKPDCSAVGRTAPRIDSDRNEKPMSEAAFVPDTPPIAMTGQAVPGVQSYDRLVAELMRRWNVPGGAVAVAKDGRLVFARGYGMADVDNGQPVQPHALFRLASISKPITAVAVLRLVEQGKLELDGRVFDILTDFPVPDPPDGDPRLKEVTLRQCLSHTGGWDRDASFDPMFRSTTAAETLGVQPPADCLTVIRYTMRQPLDFDPGQQYAYSNYGYCLLGRVIEVVTGRPYAEAVDRLVFQPAGMRRMRLGCSLREACAPDEVCYYHHTPDELANCVFPDVEDRVPWPYGGFYLEAMDSHGGWIGSAIDLLRFVTAVDGSRGEPLLAPESLAAMTARPAPPVAVDKPTYYGLGWNIRPVGDDANWWHGGSLPGTMTLLVRTSSRSENRGRLDGLAWAALFNLRPHEREKFREVLDKQLWHAAREVTEWPEHDGFDGQP